MFKIIIITNELCNHKKSYFTTYKTFAAPADKNKEGPNYIAMIWCVMLVNKEHNHPVSTCKVQRK
jgi:hypothetical protein